MPTIASPVGKNTLAEVEVEEYQDMRYAGYSGVGAAEAIGRHQESQDQCSCWRTLSLGYPLQEAKQGYAVSLPLGVGLEN